MSMGDQATADRYRIIERIGEGVHGIVLRAVDQQQDVVVGEAAAGRRQVAIKKIALRNKYGEISLNAVREIKVLQHCDHPNILALLDMFPDLSGIALVFEYIPSTLYSRLKDDAPPLSRDTIQAFAGQLLLGLEYMHGLGIMHRDIKPSNLLITDADRLKIADFGLSRLFDADLWAGQQEDVCYSPQVASRWYRAPELLWGSPKYGPAIDMWAVGCVFAEMLRGGCALFGGNTDIEQLALVIKVLGSPSVSDWPEVKTLPDFRKIRFPATKCEPWAQHFPATTMTAELSLVDQLIVYNPKHRLTATEALCCEYFQ